MRRQITYRVLPDEDFSRDLRKLRKEYMEISPESRERVRQAAIRSGRYLLDQFQRMRQELQGA